MLGIEIADLSFSPNSQLFIAFAINCYYRNVMTGIAHPTASSLRCNSFVMKSRLLVDDRGF